MQKIHNLSKESSMNHINKYTTEGIGTFFLVLTVGCTVIAGASGVIAPLAIGSILMTMIYAGAHISGAHYNPAVSLGIWLRGRMGTPDLLPYMGAQFLGAALAALAVNYLKASAVVTPLVLKPEHTLLAEFLYTFALVYVVLHVATTRANQGNAFYGLAIGFTVLAGAFAVGSISGAAFNPAVALGIALMKLLSWQDLWMYVVANFLGGAAAAYAFMCTNQSDEFHK